jgi:hypothetical protein
MGRDLSASVTDGANSIRSKAVSVSSADNGHFKPNAWAR